MHDMVDSFSFILISDAIRILSSLINSVGYT